MKKILFLFLAACFFFSCEKETIVIPQQHAGRTVAQFENLGELVKIPIFVG